MLIKCGLRYGSSEACEFAGEIAKTIAIGTFYASVALAKSKGSFWQSDTTGYWSNRNVDVKQLIEKSLRFKKLDSYLDSGILRDFRQYGIRNAGLMAVAPTGSLSTMCDVSSGIEPNFALEYTRTTKTLHGEDKTYKVHASIVDWLIEHGRISENEIGTYEPLITSHQIPWKERIAMQSAVQYWVDNSISSTINLPNETTVEEVEALYMEAFGKRLVGVTVFRDGCRRGGILKTAESQEQKIDNTSTLDYCDEELIGYKRTLKIGCSSTLHLMLFVNKYKQPVSLWLARGSEGGCTSTLNTVSRLVSLLFRNSISIDDILDQLNSTIHCASFAYKRGKQVRTSAGNSCGQAIGYAIKDILESLNISVETTESMSNIVNAYDNCPECHAELQHEGGCLVCHKCGYSKC